MNTVIAVGFAAFVVFNIVALSYSVRSIRHLNPNAPQRHVKFLMGTFAPNDVFTSEGLRCRKLARVLHLAGFCLWVLAALFAELM